VAVVDDILATVAPGTTAQSTVDDSSAGPAPERWVRLSTRAHRWYLPTRNRAASRGSLLIHQPMRRGAQLAWRAAAATAGSGVLRLLPAHELPSVHRLIVPHIPPGGTTAISTRRVGTRSMALTLDAAGRPHAFIKLADTDVGRSRLASEVDAVRRFGPLLPPNVIAPEVLHAEPGLVVFEAAQWRVRPKPWRLDPELAHSMGRFFALAGNADGHTGPAHGDFAPWNVMRLDDGWCLIDWEEATDGRPPFEDPFHYVVQACTLLGRPREDDIFDGLHLKGPVGEVFAAYADGAGISTDDLPERFRHYLEQTTDWDPEARGRLHAALTAHSPPGTR
jgi:hypothetical protein